jgi:hypothetical protein
MSKRSDLHLQIADIDNAPRPHRASWKEAMRLFSRPVWRLHHYRDLHTQMIRDAFSDVDCARKLQECGDE